MMIPVLSSFTEVVQISNSKNMDDVDIFVQNDPYGALMAILGMGIVFLILLLLYFVFSNTPLIYSPETKIWWANLFSKKGKENNATTEVKDLKPADMSGEVNAAIAAAIHLYRSELHDYENTVLTISKVSRTYSPWSSKIYGLRHAPK